MAELRRAALTQIPVVLLDEAMDLGRMGKPLVVVYLRLWDYAGDRDTAFPSVDRLALECRMKDDDVRWCLQWLSRRGWVRRQDRPGQTTLFHVRTERPLPPEGDPPRRGSPSRGAHETQPSSRQRSQSDPSPPRGIPPEGDPPRGGSPRKGSPPLPPEGEPTPPPRGGGEQEPINKNQGTRNQEPPQPPSPGVEGGASGDPVIEEPEAAARALLAAHRPIAVAWWRERALRHPDAPKALTPLDLRALQHAEAAGVLPQFLQAAAAGGWRSLHTAYRSRIAALAAPPGSTDGFEEFRRAYLAAPRRVTSQSIDRAIPAYATALRTGGSPDGLLRALQAEIEAQAAATARGEFVPSLPDIARWLRDGRWKAYIDPPPAPPPPRFAPQGPELPIAPPVALTPAQRLERARARRAAQAQQP